MTTFFYWSHSLDTTSPTAHENAGQSAAAATNALTGADVPAILPPPIAKFRMTKRLRQVMKNNSQAGGTDTCHASRQRPYDFRTPAARLRTWRIWSVDFTTSHLDSGTYHPQSPTRTKPCPLSLLAPLRQRHRFRHHQCPVDPKVPSAS